MRSSVDGTIAQFGYAKYPNEHVSETEWMGLQNSACLRFAMTGSTQTTSASWQWTLRSSVFRSFFFPLCFHYVCWDLYHRFAVVACSQMYRSSALAPIY